VIDRIVLSIPNVFTTSILIVTVVFGAKAHTASGSFVHGML
jgi:hypothetical protein